MVLLVNNIVSYWSEPRMTMSVEQAGMTLVDPMAYAEEVRLHEACTGWTGVRRTTRSG